MQGVGEDGGGGGHAGSLEDAWKGSKVLGGIPVQGGSAAQGSRITPYPYAMPHPWPPLPIVQAPPFPPPPQLPPPPVFISPPPYLPYIYPAVPTPYYAAPYTNPYPAFPVAPRSDIAPAPYPCTTWTYGYSCANAMDPSVNNSVSPVSVVSAPPSTLSGGDSIPPVVSVVKTTAGGDMMGGGGTVEPAPTQSDMAVSEEAHMATMDGLRRRLDAPLSYGKKRGRERMAGQQSLSRKQEQPTVSTEMTDEDRMRLLSAPVDQWVDSTYEAALRFMNVKRRPRSLSRQEERGMGASSQGKVKAVESSASAGMPVQEQEALGTTDVAESSRCQSFPKVANTIYQNGTERQCERYRISGVPRDLNKVAEQEASGTEATRSPTVDSGLAFVQYDIPDTGRAVVLPQRDDRKPCKGGAGQVSSESVTSSKAETLNRGMTERSRIICREFLGGRSIQSCISVQEGMVSGDGWARPPTTQQVSYDGDGGSSLSQSSVSGYVEGWPDDWRRGRAQSDAAKAVEWGVDCSAGRDTRTRTTMNGKSGSELINVEREDKMMWNVAVQDRAHSPQYGKTESNGLAKEGTGKGHNKGEVVNESEEGVVDIISGTAGRKVRQFDLRGPKDWSEKPEVISVDDDDDDDDVCNNGMRWSEKDSSCNRGNMRKAANGGGLGAVDDVLGAEKGHKFVFQLLLKKPLCDRSGAEDGRLVHPGVKCSGSASGSGGGVMGLFRSKDTVQVQFDMDACQNLREEGGFGSGRRPLNADTGLGFARCA